MNLSISVIISLFFGYGLLYGGRYIKVRNAKNRRIEQLLLDGERTIAELREVARHENWLNEYFNLQPPTHQAYSLVDYAVMGKVYGALLPQEFSTIQTSYTSRKRNVPEITRAICDQLLTWPLADRQRFITGVAQTNTNAAEDMGYYCNQTCSSREELL